MKRSELRKIIQEEVGLVFPDGTINGGPDPKKKKLEEWGSSDQNIMNKAMHDDLGKPKKFPGLSEIMQVAEEAVDFYWDDWPDYRHKRDNLINHAATMYMRAYWNDIYKGFQKMFKERVMQEELLKEGTEHYIVFQGDDIIGEGNKSHAEAIYDKTKEGKRPSQWVALYKQVKEKKEKR